MSDEQLLPLIPHEGNDLPLAPRASSRTATRTGAAFGAVEVGPPVSRLAWPEPSRHRAGLPDGQVAGDADGSIPGGTDGAVGADHEAPAAAPDAQAAVEAAQRCASCGARLRAEQDWCSLCHAARRPAAADVNHTDGHTDEHVQRPAGVPRLREDDDGQLALDLEAFSEPRGVPEEEVERMLAELAGSDGPGLRGLRSRQAKVVVAIGGGLGLTGLLLGAAAALGAVLG